MARARIGATILTVLATALVAVGAVLLVGDGARADQDDGRRRTRTVTVDVAENGHEFVFDEAPVFGEEAGDLAGFPAYGNAFVTGGYLYPEGTLGDSDGVNPDGSPEFPDKVIGRWFCRGAFINDGAATSEGSWVYTTQLFSFGDEPDAGRETVVVVGLEGAVVGEPVVGAVTGGTGRLRTAHGEAIQTLLGFNNPEAPTAGINKTVELRLRR